MAWQFPGFAAVEPSGLATGALVLLRVFPVILLTPVFGGTLLPVRVRVAFALVVTAVLTPLVPPIVPPDRDLTMVAMGARELLFGLSIAMCVRLTFELLASCGAIVDSTRGAMIAPQFDPLAQQPNSVLTQFVRNVVLVAFFTMGGAPFFLRTLAGTFVGMPPGSPVEGRLDPANVAHWIELVSTLFGVAVHLAAPAVLLLFLADLALGLLNRAAPQIPVFFLGLTFKGPLALLALLASFGVVLSRQLELALSTAIAWMTG